MTEAPLWREPAWLGLPVLAAMVAGALLLQPGRKPATPVDATTEGVSYGVTQPLPSSIDGSSSKVALGRLLFHDVRLSSDNTISCASCHPIAFGGMDGRVRSLGVGGAEGDINAPTVLNSAFNFVQFWDGRAPTLEAQVDGPVHNPKEMASNWAQVEVKLLGDAEIARRFRALYADGITPNNIRDAIATYERSLVTPNAPFDRFLRNEPNALTTEQRRGWDLFQSYGCASCHQGINLGGNMFQKMGLLGDYFADRGNVTEADNGRYNFTRRIENLHEFRVPTLRNVELTAPYFHDGSAATLEHATIVMARYQLGRPMPTDDVAAITAFLRSLTGQLPGETP